jgi:hypothetical protein
MIAANVPFRRWPLRWHVYAATATLGVAVLAGLWITRGNQVLLKDAQAELNALQSQLSQTRRVGPADPSELFAKALPDRVVAEKVARDITAFGTTLNVQISSLTVEPRASTPTELGSVHFNVAARGEYKNTKSWIAELLGRYPSLALQTLSLQAAPNDASRQEVRLTMVLYVKD